MSTFNRKSTPRVKRGRVQKKNNWEETPNYYSTFQVVPIIDRRRPGYGYRHLLMQRDVLRFIELLPEWDEIARELDAIVLAPGRASYYGYYTPGVVHVCAWPNELWEEYSPSFYEERRSNLELLGVPCEEYGGQIRLHWTDWTARADQLLFTFLHELGHHHDALTTKQGGIANRGENYAEWYARQYTDVIWTRYCKVFPQSP